MPLNLINDAWIPVIDKSGDRHVIAPWQMADPDLSRPDWPRADLNIACIELLIGLVMLADPPAHSEDWEDRQTPDPERLRDRLQPFAPAFDLLGDGPRFMQELGGLDGEVRAADMLFVDSGGEGGTLMVRGGRYPSLDLPTAAMALYAMQTQAPSGGRGNLTSMRGGGPMTVMVDPGGGLWPLIWANVPDGKPARPEDLPWMRPTFGSDRGSYFPDQGHPSEVFFCRPRRFWLLAEGDHVTGVIQRPNGTRYAGWTHPLTAYYRQKAGDEPLPVRPRAGVFSYRHWLGITLRDPSGLREVPATVRMWEGLRGPDRPAHLIVAGWSMDNMKALDYLHSRPPLVPLDDAGQARLLGMVAAAEQLAVALRGALAPVLAEGEAREAAREQFYIRTQPAFEARLHDLAQGAEPDDVARRWLADMRHEGMAIFEALALPGLADRMVQDQKAIIDAHRNLAFAFAGYTPLGGKAFGALGLPAPKRKQQEAA